MFGFLSLNRIFFSPKDNRLRPISSLYANFRTPLLKLFLVLLLGFLAILTFPSSSLASSPTTVGADFRIAVSGDIDADKLDQFAQAYLQVLQLLSDRQSELPEDDTSPAALDIQQSIEADTIKIIQGSGLTLPEYMQILELANQDEAFQRRIFDRSSAAQ